MEYEWDDIDVDYFVEYLVWINECREIILINM